MPIVAVVVGVVLGAALFSVGRSDLWITGMLVGGALGYLLAALARLHGRVLALEAMQRAREQAAASTVAVAPPPVPARAAPPPEAPEEIAPPAPPPIAPAPSWDEPAPARAVTESALLRSARELVAGGNTLVRLGVVVLFFGVAFLLKYAAEREMLPAELRLSGAALGAAALLALGWRLRARRALYALALQGGGVGILYLTVFAALRLYQLIPPGAAFAVLVAVAALAAALAVLQEARSLAVLGAAGGFLAPVLASTGAGDHVALFSYYALLNAGIVAVAWFRAWRELNLLGFAFTFVIGTLWGGRYYHPGLFATTEPFLALFFVLYVAIAVLFATRQPPRLKGLVDGTLVFGVPVVGFALQALLMREYEYGLAWSALAAGVLYLALAAALLRRTRLSLLGESFLALGTVFATLAIPLALDARWTAAAWAVEGAAIVWVSARQQRLAGRVFGTLLVFGAGVAFLAGAQRPAADVPILNGLYLGCVLVSAAAILAGRVLAHPRPDARAWERAVSYALLAWALVWWYGGGLHEIGRHADGRYELAWLVGGLGFSALFAEALGTRLGWNALRYSALGLAPLGLAAAALSWFDQPHPFAHGGALAWPLLLASHLLVLRRHDALPARGYLAFLHGATVWLVALLFAQELAWLTHYAVEGARTWALAARGLALGLVLTAVSAALGAPRWPWRPFSPAYATVGLLPVGLAALAWSLAANATSRGDATPLAYLPLLNPLDLAQAFLFLAALAWFRRYHGARDAAFARERLRVFGVVFGGALFAWLNAALLRTLHHWAAVPFTWRAMLDSVLVQAALSIFWTLIALALMLAATRRAWRWLWILGAVLLGVVVVKLFLVDLARTGTIARIVSFLVVGVLLLLVGYFSPVPPRREEGAERS